MYRSNGLAHDGVLAAHHARCPGLSPQDHNKQTRVVPHYTGFFFFLRFALFGLAILTSPGIDGFLETYYRHEDQG